MASKVRKKKREELLNLQEVLRQGTVVPPKDWTPGKVKARKYNTIQKGVHHDTTTEPLLLRSKRR